MPLNRKTCTGAKRVQPPSGSLLCPLVLLAALSSFVSVAAHAGGVLKIDYRLSMHDSGIRQRRNQVILEDAVVGAVLAGALWEGGDTRIGRTWWQSVDSVALGAASSEFMKRVFTRERPSTTTNPDRWFEGGSNHSFPSGEVTLMAAAITPFVLEYGREYPAVYALELLPLYDGMARMRVRAHWQTDVLAGWALGTATGYISHSLDKPFVLSILPHGFSAGIKAAF